MRAAPPSGSASRCRTWSRGELEGRCYHAGVTKESSKPAKGRRLQTRVARYIAFTVAMSLVASGIALIYVRHRSLSRSMEKAARTYAELLSLPVASEVETFRSAGHGRLIPQVNRWMALNPNLIRLQVVHVSGQVFLDARPLEVATFAEWQEAPRIADPQLLAEVEGIEVVARQVRPLTGERTVYRVVAPVVEELGRRRMTVVATFSYANVRRELFQMVGVAGVLLAASLLVAGRVSVALAATITRSVNRLHSGVRRIQEGHLGERVDVTSGDEIQDLAEAFNALTDAQRQTIERLREANRELESLDQTKADLLANVSHELKTPLTALRGYLELLEQGDLGAVSEDAVRAVEICQKNVERLGARIEELVQLATLERERDLAEQSMETVHLGNLLHGVVETLLPRIEEKSLRCSLNLAIDLPPVWANPEQLERAILNVLENAVKFTPENGGIRVSAEPHIHHERRGVLVRITDTGVGIPSTEVVRIFDRFHQVDPSVRRRYGGMGLGLSLVRNIVEGHRGVVWAESESGHGSTFFIWLPWRSGEESSAIYPAITLHDAAGPDSPSDGYPAVRNDARNGTERRRL